MTPEQRRLRAQIAANTRWSRPMAREDQAAAARSALYSRLEREVDPHGELPPDERARRVHSAARALSARLNSAKTRRRSHRAASLCTGLSAACVGGFLVSRFSNSAARTGITVGSISDTSCGLQSPVHGFDSRLRLSAFGELPLTRHRTPPPSITDGN